MRVAVLAVSGVVDSGYGLVLDVFDAANLLAGHVGTQGRPFEIRTVGLARSVRTAHGLRLETESWTALHDDPPDVLVLPSLGLITADAVVDVVRDHATLPGLRALHESGTRLAGACSATFFLAEAGLLDDVNATTSWWLGPAFRGRYPRVRLDEKQALAVAGTITTAGAAIAHVDLAMSVVRHVSPALSGLVADYLAVGDRPRQSAVAVPSLLAASDPVLAGFDNFVRENLAGTIRIGAAASALGVSERTLQRITTDMLGVSPIRYVQQVRLDHAIRLLRTTNRTADHIANAVGYRDAATLRTLIRRTHGTTLSELRRRASS